MKRATLHLVLLGALIFCACDSGGAAGSPAPTATPPPAEFTVVGKYRTPGEPLDGYVVEIIVAGAVGTLRVSSTCYRAAELGSVLDSKCRSGR